jgi:GDP-4-dehydro-6-deoxy-D-mannose reductase
MRGALALKDKNMAKKILITGGTGFVGRHLTTLLQKLEPEAELHLTSLKSTTENDLVLTHTLDLTDPAALQKLFEQQPVDEIYHLASLASVGEALAHPSEVIDNNFRLTLNLLETLRHLDHPPRLLLISSSEIYDWRQTSTLDEKAVLKPANPYAASKAIQDALGQSYAASYGLPIIIARPFNHIGPGQRQGFVVADFAAKIVAVEGMAQEDPISVGNLETYRDFTDVRDVVKAYHLLMSQGVVGETYNIGSGRAVKIADLLEEMLTLAKRDLTYKVDDKMLRPVDAPKIVADSSKISSLGWQPKIDLTRTLEDTLNYWRGII